MEQKIDVSSLLTTLYQYQQAGHLCDVTVMSSDGRHFDAHAGVLAAASSMLAQQLSECDRGNYTIEMPLNSLDTDAFVKCAYTGMKQPSHMCNDKLQQLCDLFEFHEKQIIFILKEFAEKGLFCNMAWNTFDRQIRPTHSYIVAAEFDFMSQHIMTGSIVYVTISDKTQEGINYYATSPKNMMNSYKYVCEICDKRFKHCSRLEEHLRLHTGELSHATDNPYKCVTCQKVFGSINELKKHAIKHTDEKPFICNTCNKSYKRNNELKLHKLIHVDEKPYVCSACDKAFRTNTELKNHEIMHNDDKPFTCTTCDKCFRRKRDLKVHDRLHTKELPYKCATCEKRFRSSSELKRVDRPHSDLNTYKCVPCVRSLPYEKMH